MNEDIVKEGLKQAKESVKQGNYADALERIRGVARPEHDFSLQHRYANIFRSIPRDALKLQPIRIAISATSTVDHLADVLKLWLGLEGFEADVYIAEYDTMSQTVLDPESELYKFQPDIVWLFSNYRDVAQGAPACASPEQVISEVDSAVDSFAALWESLKSNSNAYIIQNNADLPAERVFGNLEGSVCWGRQNILREFNSRLARVSVPGVTIFDIDYISAQIGKAAWFDERYWYHSKHAFSLSACGCVAFQMARLVGAIKGRSKKCLVLDLDNTLWGGVIGDDGLEGIKLATDADGEAFVAFQKYLLSLKERGIILAVCSKNEEENAKLPFLQHPDMVLKLEDIAVFKANWNTKVENIREIAETLDIGLDSLVFVDDSKFERDMVRGMLPMVCVPEMPEDPALYIRTLDSQKYFETVGFSFEDGKRAAMYRENAVRKDFKNKFENVDAYLQGLGMEALVGRFDSINMPRIAQLVNKSNQFHPTTTRYTESQIERFMGDEEKICLYFRLKDRFGDNGLISALILQKQGGEALYIDTWVMSCRVLSRGMEEFINNEMIRIARDNGFRKIIGKYIPTDKNKIVEKLYGRLGYTLVSDNGGTTLWELKIDEETQAAKCFIARREKES